MTGRGGPEGGPSIYQLIQQQDQMGEQLDPERELPRLRARHKKVFDSMTRQKKSELEVMRKDFEDAKAYEELHVDQRADVDNGRKEYLLKGAIVKLHSRSSASGTLPREVLDQIYDRQYTVDELDREWDEVMPNLTEGENKELKEDFDNWRRDDGSVMNTLEDYADHIRKDVKESGLDYMHKMAYESLSVDRKREIIREEMRAAVGQS